jgi:hypothetical protein
MSLAGVLRKTQSTNACVFSLEPVELAFKRDVNHSGLRRPGRCAVSAQPCEGMRVGANGDGLAPLFLR